MIRRLAVAALCAAAIVGAQSLPVHLSGTAGYATFLDDSDQSHVSVGGSARFYLTRRNAIEPEVLFLYRDAADKDLLVQANYVRDLGRATGNAVLYFIGGAGFISGYRPGFTITNSTASAGFGVRIYASSRFFVSPEVRIGSEPILRLEVKFGWSTKRR